MGIDSYQVPAYDITPMKAGDYGLGQFRSYNVNQSYSGNNTYQVNNCGRYN